MRRNDLPAAIKELKGTTTLDELQNVFRKTIQMSSEDAAADAAATYERLEKIGIKDIGKNEFIEKYKAGLRFDEGTRMWYDPVKGVGKELVPMALKTEEVLAKLKTSEGFGPYAKVLTDNGIATEDELLRTLEGLRPQGRSLDDVRHQLKQAFREKLVARMVDPNKSVMENYKEMRRLTDGLASSDKGTLFEIWYQRVLLPGGVRHMEVSAEELAKLGSEYGVKRFPDLIEGDVLHELKAYSVALGADSKEQFLDNMHVLWKKVKIGEEERVLNRVVYTLPIPEGVRANATWMRDQLLSYQGKLSFQLFNSAGESRMISTAADIQNPALWKWLGVGMPSF